MVDSDDAAARHVLGPGQRHHECGRARQPAVAELHHTCRQAPGMVMMRHVSLVTGLANMTNARSMCVIRHSRWRMDAERLDDVRMWQRL
ncbi:hypothetical protein DZD52_20410 [Xanthomonas nasturtii]|uniref:Uncharacterized protein n=1 Tax=Xanthomonas nasturtii TaxID=1843581 RepID=A0A3E1KDX1_9XANT|nr:hypothetical protein DZD52_20410 [Xanthomonas nasturtii]